MQTIKRIGLAALAALAITAFLNVAAASASTSGFKAATYPAVLKGVKYEGVKADQRLLAPGGATYECFPPAFNSGSQGGPFSILQVAEYETAGTCLTVYHGGGEGVRSMAMNGCKFGFDPGAAPSFTGSLTLGPPGCGPIYIEDMFYNCDFSIQPSTTTVGSAAFENSSGKVNVFGEATKLTVTKVGSPVECGTTPETYKWYPDWKVSGENLVGESDSIEVASELPFGFYLAGKESAKESEQPRFEAEVYPRSISGGGLPTVVTSGGTTTCEESSLTGSLTKANKQLSLSGTYGKCNTVAVGGAVWPTTVVMNGCSYTLTANNVGPPYTGNLGVVCPEGKKIEYKLFKKDGSLNCIATLGAQTGLTGISLANTGSGINRAVSLNAKVEGVKIEGCGVVGTSTISGTPTLTG